MLLVILAVDRDYTAGDRLGRQQMVACVVNDRFGRQHR